MPLPEAAKSVGYHSCIVNLNVRFDELLLGAVDEANGITTDDAAREPASVPGKSSRVASAVEQSATSKNSTQTNFILGRIPKRCTVELPSVRQAGTFDLEISFRDLPIDPRTLRSAGVEIYMGTVTPSEFADGMTHQPPRGQQRRSVLRPRSNFTINPNMNNIVMIGVVDEWSVDYGDEETSISLKGRDLRGILLDSPLSVNALNRLNLDQRIDALVRQLLNMHPLMGNLDIQVNPAEWPNGRVPAALPDSILPRHRRAARGGGTSAAAAFPPGAASGSTGGGTLTFWDAIVRFCFLAGAIPYFSVRTLVIRPTRTYFEQAGAGFDPNILTPFNPSVPRVVGDMAPFSVRRLVYGRDIEKVTFNRKFGGAQKPKVVRVVSVDLSSTNRQNNRVIEVRWPPTRPRQTQRTQPTPHGTQTPPTAPTAASERAATNRVTPSGDSQNETINIRVQGITDRRQLEIIAHSLFEEIGRNELTGSIETKNVWSFGGDNDDPDLLRARPGDAIQLFFDTSGVHSGEDSVVSSATDHYRRPLGDATREIAERIGNRDLARAIMATVRGSINHIQNFFRISAVHITWDNDTGINLSLDFQNYFVIRNELNANAQSTANTPPRRAHHGNRAHASVNTPPNAQPTAGPNFLANGRSIAAIRRVFQPQENVQRFTFERVETTTTNSRPINTARDLRQLLAEQGNSLRLTFRR